MKQPKQGLKGLVEGQILKLLKPVYGRPDAPRAWFDELSRILQKELSFEHSSTDPALFMLRDSHRKLRGLLIVHVGDLMFCHDGTSFGQQATDRLKARFPFGTWLPVAQQVAGVTYCGKEIRVGQQEGEPGILLSQDGFVSGRLQPMELSVERKRNKEALATDTERTDYRSVVGSLQWLVTQSRPDIAFEVNQLQKRIPDLRVEDLLRANRAVKEVTRHRVQICFKNVGLDAELVAYHDAGLFNSVGVELEEQQAEDLLLQGTEKKLVYSQKGVVLGLVRRGMTKSQQGGVHFNLLDWKSSTNRRVVESSFAAETHAAVTALGMTKFCQVLLSEIRFGSDVVSAVEDDGWQSLTPATLVTDCKSISYMLCCCAKLCQLGKSDCKAQLLWVPTRHQIADALTKGGKASDFRAHLAQGLVFHERALPKRKRCTSQREVDTSVNDRSSA